MGRALLVASDKGGVGKSTTATNPASYLVNNSRTVIILKTDKNNDILSWNEKKKAEWLITGSCL
ncbi:P-loop NTPase (plasmid) [Escherichia coli]|nr:P-loop NTPase [Escherichia coli]